MKNVAGYDVSRLVCGAYGTLGLLADLSLKVVPAPELEKTITRECSSDVARETVKLLSNRVSSLSASCYSGGTLSVRLSGNEQAVKATEEMLEGTQGDNAFWDQLDSQALSGGYLPMLMNHCSIMILQYWIGGSPSAGCSIRNRTHEMAMQVPDTGPESGMIKTDLKPRHFNLCRPWNSCFIVDSKPLLILVAFLTQGVCTVRKASSADQYPSKPDRAAQSAGGGCHTAKMCALRVLYSHLSNLSIARR